MGKKSVAIIVNNYLQTQGVNSVVDQFIANKDFFLKQGISISGVYDRNKYYDEIPYRFGERNSTKRFKKNIKKQALCSTSFFQILIVIIRYWINGYYVYRNYCRKKHSENLIISQDGIMAFYHLRKKSCEKLVYMTHIFKDELEQLLLDYPKIKNTWIEKKLRYMLTYVYNNAEAVITICSEAKKHITSIANPNHISIIYNSVTDPSLSVTQRGSGKLKFVTASSLNQRKGTDLLIEVISSIGDINKDCEFHIFGDGEYKENLVSFVNDFEYKNVFYYGRVNNPVTKYTDKDVFFMISRNETLPMGIIEAMSVGLPILSTDVGAVKELVDDGVNGYCVNCTKEAYIDALKNILKRKDLLSQMGNESRKKYLLLFSNFTWVNSFSEVINSII